MKFANLHCHSHFSLLDAISKPKDIVKKYKELGFIGGAITDHGSISSAVEFVEEAKKENIKWILGNEFNITPQSAQIRERGYSHLVILAKNPEGWKNLIRATSRSNDEDCFYYKPRLGFDEFRPFTKNLIAISGHVGSTIADSLFTDLSAYSCKTKEDCYKYLRVDVEKVLREQVQLHQSLFDDFYLEVQLYDKWMMPAQEVLTEVLRSQSKKLGVRCVATTDAHYINQSDAVDQRILLCSNLRKTLKEVEQEGDDFGLSCFFNTDRHYILSLPELQQVGHTEDELQCTVDIANSIEDYEILSKPQLPKFKTPNNKSEIDYLKELAREGWRNKIIPVLTNSNEKEYSKRIKEELDTIEKADLAGYFLIVQDMITFYENSGGIKSPGRGSVGGSLLAYLLGITTVDPIPHGLMFSRFYNKSRAGSLPDIDTDFEPEYRDSIVKYLEDKYGIDKVAHMATFGRLMGRSALSEVLRIHNVCSFSEIKRITEHIPDEAKIADDLTEMEKEGEEKSIILWCLQNKAEKFNQWCRYKNGKFEGEYAQYFEQAIRLEGTFKSQGKHAAGIIIANESLHDVCPLIRDKNGEKICGMEMEALEKIGLVKLDCLGLNSLSKLKIVNQLLQEK